MKIPCPYFTDNLGSNSKCMLHIVPTTEFDASIPVDGLHFAALEVGPEAGFVEHGADDVLERFGFGVRSSNHVELAVLLFAEGFLASDGKFDRVDWRLLSLCWNKTYFAQKAEAQFDLIPRCASAPS